MPSTYQPHPIGAMDSLPSYPHSVHPPWHSPFHDGPTHTRGRGVLRHPTNATAFTGLLWPSLGGLATAATATGPVAARVTAKHPHIDAQEHSRQQNEADCQPAARRRGGLASMAAPRLLQAALEARAPRAAPCESYQLCCRSSEAPASHCAARSTCAVAAAHTLAYAAYGAVSTFTAAMTSIM